MLVANLVMADRLDAARQAVKRMLEVQPDGHRRRLRPCRLDPAGPDGKVRKRVAKCGSPWLNKGRTLPSRGFWGRLPTALVLPGKATSAGGVHVRQSARRRTIPGAGADGLMRPYIEQSAGPRLPKLCGPTFMMRCESKKWLTPP